jgi:hypothetical protein
MRQVFHHSSDGFLLAEDVREVTEGAGGFGFYCSQLLETRIAVVLTASSTQPDATQAMNGLTAVAARSVHGPLDKIRQLGVPKCLATLMLSRLAPCREVLTVVPR